MKVNLPAKVEKQLFDRIQGYIDLKKTQGFRSYSRSAFVDEACSFYLGYLENKLVVENLGLKDQVLTLEHVSKRLVDITAQSEINQENIFKLDETIRKTIEEEFELLVKAILKK